MAHRKHSSEKVDNSVGLYENETFEPSFSGIDDFTELLGADIRFENKYNRGISWYHGTLSRADAEVKLKNGPNKSGTFLVRDNTSCDQSYSLSFLHDGQVEHFKIKSIRPHLYSIDDGPLIQGIDCLIKEYQRKAGGLPTILTSPVMGNPPPMNTRLYGYKNLLHRAVDEGKVSVIEKILANAQCPDVNAKDDKGSTVIHDASFKGLKSVVTLLLSQGSDANIRDSHGYTALHRACSANHGDIVSTLLTQGKANLHERCHVNGWVPLHEAATKGHIKCVEVLLGFEAPKEPRDDSNQTPEDLATLHKHHQCAYYLENYSPPRARTNKNQWYHDCLQRQGCVELLQKHGMVDGLFLVRPKSKPPKCPVLCLVHDQRVYYYEIMSENGSKYHIDDGPYFPSLEHFIQHYCKMADGLPCTLSVAISPDGTAKPIIIPPISAAKPTLNSPQVNGREPAVPPIPNTPRPKPSTPIDKPSVTKPNVPKKPDAEYSDEMVHSTPLRTIKRKHIKLGSELGQGEYGSVLKGTWKNINRKRIPVAIKTLHEENIQSGMDEFLREARVMMGLDHVCIVQLIGVCEGPPMMLVQELMPMGSMLDFLLDESEQIDVQKDLYLWAAQIACGMMYLEGKRFVHRDLAARNILLESKQQAKISDFGLSRAVGAGSDYYRASKGGRWPVKWYAPESVNYGTFSHSSDVWSFGVTLWEMFTFGDQPYGDMNGAQVIAIIEKGNRLQQPDNCDNSVYETMLNCWSYEPSGRPTFKQLNNHFTEDPIYADIQGLVRGR